VKFQFQRAAAQKSDQLDATWLSEPAETEVVSLDESVLERRLG